MSKRVVIEPEAEADIAQAYRWYENHRLGLGDDFLLCLEAALSVIAARPRSFLEIRKSVRRILIKRFPYQIIFVDRTDKILVIGVFHSSRNPKLSARRRP